MVPVSEEQLDALRCAGVGAAYGPRVVLREVNAAFQGGTLTAVIGPNGCGKSTLLRVLLGAVAPRGGRVTIGGAAVASLSGAARAERLAFIAQRPEVWAAFTVREVVGFGRYALGLSALAVEAALGRMDLRRCEADPVATLSEGQRQRVALARVLAQFHHKGEPGRVRAVLADEPFAAMDPRHALHALGVLRELAESATAVVVVMHDLNLARRHADRVLMIDGEGRVAAHGPAAEVLTPARLERVFETVFDDGQPSLMARTGAGNAPL
ncbi:MAG: ABC transporter ATP-binding protein [Phycisphaerales bacterium]